MLATWGTSTGFNPASLFAGGVQGAWYDPSDNTTMFQDSAGTTPVTAVEQAVGLILDKSKGLVLGPELVTNGNFANGTTGWTITGAWAESGGQFVKTGGSTATASQAILTIGKTYRITVDVVAVSTSVLIYAGSGNAQTVTTPGTKTFTVVCLGDTSLYVQCLTTATATIDNISVRELAGNHAFQSTSASRPTLRARYNLLTYSEQFDNAAWVKAAGGGGSAPVVTPNDAVAPDGTTTADKIVFAAPISGDQSQIYSTPSSPAGALTGYISVKAVAAGDVGKVIGFRHVANGSYTLVTLTADWQRVSVTETRVGDNFELILRPAVGTSSGTVSVYVWGADLRRSSDTNIPYQRIAAATDYATGAAFPQYLAFDGTDDSLLTANVDFSGTDKMTVWSGLSKLSDALGNILTELTASGFSTQGGFYLSAPNGDTLANYGFVTQGSFFAPTTYAAPITNVLTCSYDLSASTRATEIIPRINGILNQTGGSGTGTATGNFANAPLYIGRRNNASLPFNGRIYSLIVRGAASNTTQVAQTERYVASKTPLGVVP